MAPPDASIRVLAIDDDEVVADLVATVLGRETGRLSVDIATSGAEAVAAFEDGSFDCVVCDYHLPDTTGIEVTRRLRERSPELPVVFFSNEGAQAAVEDAMAAGATEYLLKTTGMEGYRVLADRLLDLVDGAGAGRTDEAAGDGTVLEAITGGGYTLDGDWRITEVSDRALDDLSMPREALVGSVLWEAFPGARGSAFEAGFREAVGAGEPTDFEVRSAVSDGRLEVTAIPTGGGLAVRVRPAPRGVTAARAAFKRLDEALFDAETPEAAIETTVAAASRLVDGTVTFDPAADAGTGGDGATALVAPVADRGALRVEAATDADDESLRSDLELLAGAATAAIERLEREHELRANRDKIEALHEVASRIERSDTVEAVCDRAVEAAQGILEFDLCLVSLENDGMLEVTATSHDLPPGGARAMSVEEGLTGKTYRTGESSLIEDVADAPEADPQGPYRSALSVPIAQHGVMQAVSESVGAFDEADLRHAELLVAHVSAALSRIERERELRRYEATVEAAGDAVYTLDTDRNVTSVNDSFLEFSGYTREELLGEHVSTFLTPEALATGTSAVDDLRENPEQRRARFEFEAERPNGETRVYEDSVALLTDEDGTITGTVGVIRDITERRELEEQLRAQNARLRTLVSNLPLVLFVLDADGVFLESEGKGLEALGRAPGESVGESVFDLYAGVPAITRAVSRALDGERVQRTVDLGDHVFDAWYEPVTDADGGVEQVIGVAVDVTARHELQRRLREQSDQLRTVVEIAADPDRSLDAKLYRMLELGREALGLPAGYVTEYDGELQRVTHAAGDTGRVEEGFEIPLSESYIQQADAPDDLVEFADAADAGAIGPVYERLGFAAYIGRKLTEAAVPNGTLCFVGDRPREGFTDFERTFIDILTQVVGYERSRHRTEERLRALQRTAQELTVAEDREAVATIAVEAVRDVLGLPVTAMWRYDGETDRLVPLAETEAARELVGTAPTFERGEALAWTAFDTGELRFYRDLESRSDRYNPDTPLESEVHVPVGEHGVITAASTSPTGLDGADTGLLQLFAASVEAALTRTDREEELRRRETELRHQNERLEEFASVIAHDLRNPLSGAMGFLELVQETEDTQYLERVDRALHRMEELIEDLLEIARQQRRVTERRPVELAGVIREAWEYVDTPGSELTLEPGLGAIEADEARLLQLFGNLFRNAIEHAGDDVRVEVGPVDGEGFYVADDGPGIPEADQDRVLEFGYSTREGNTGKGLSIVTGIASAHGWDIAIAEADGGGARFEFTGVGVDGAAPREP